MTTQFDNYFHNLIENMTVNDVANVGTGWFDSTKGSVPKVLGCMQKRNGSCSKKRKKNKR